MLIDFLISVAKRGLCERDEWANVGLKKNIDWVGIGAGYEVPGGASFKHPIGII